MRRAVLVTALVLLVLLDIGLATNALVLVFLDVLFTAHGVTGGGWVPLILIELVALTALVWLTLTVWRAASTA